MVGYGSVIAKAARVFSRMAKSQTLPNVTVFQPAKRDALFKMRTEQSGRGFWEDWRDSTGNIGRRYRWTGITLDKPPGASLLIMRGPSGRRAKIKFSSCLEGGGFFRMPDSLQRQTCLS